LHGAVLTALKLADPRDGCPIILAFSDGRDIVGVLSDEQLLRVAQESNAVVYVVSGQIPLRGDISPIDRQLDSGYVG
jgi:hypothetical protein